MYSQKNYFELGLKVKNHKSIYRGFEISEIRKQLLIYNNGYDLIKIIPKDKTLSPKYNIAMAQNFIDNYMRKEN